MTHNEFDQPVSVDFAPHGSVCEWCGQAAEQQLTVIGGSMHNEGGYFCRSCGEKFVQAVIQKLQSSAQASAEESSLSRMNAQ